VQKPRSDRWSGATGVCDSAFIKEALTRVPAFKWNESKLPPKAQRIKSCEVFVGSMSTYSVVGQPPALTGLFVIRPDGMSHIQSGFGNSGNGVLDRCAAWLPSCLWVCRGGGVGKIAKSHGATTGKNLPGPALPVGQPDDPRHERSAHAVAMPLEKAARDRGHVILASILTITMFANERVFRKGGCAECPLQKPLNALFQLGGVYDGHDPSPGHKIMHSGVGHVSFRSRIAGSSRDSLPRTDGKHILVMLLHFAEVEVAVGTGQYVILLDFLLTLRCWHRAPSKSSRRPDSWALGLRVHCHAIGRSGSTPAIRPARGQCLSSTLPIRRRFFDIPEKMPGAVELPDPELPLARRHLRAPVGGGCAANLELPLSECSRWTRFFPARAVTSEPSSWLLWRLAVRCMIP